MKRFIIIFICAIFIIGCVSHNLRSYKPLVKNEKSITVPPGGLMLIGAIKDVLQKNNWVLYVDKAQTVHKGEINPSVNVTSKEVFKTRYRLNIKFQQYDVCIPGGRDNPALFYDIAITDNNDDAEVMSLSGQGCQRHIVEKFEEWLNSK